MRAVRLRATDETPAGLAALGLDPPRPVIVLVGGAGGLDDAAAADLQGALADGLLVAAQRTAAVAVDGGTDAGVMRVLGHAHHAAGVQTPLVGVAAVGTVVIPDQPAPSEDVAPLEPHHTHFVLVPGDEWGAEAPWISTVATTVSDGVPSVTVLVNGGEIAYDDVERSIDARRPVVTVAGSGRTADRLAAALRGADADHRAVSLVRSGLVRAVPLDDPTLVARTITDLLDAGAARGV